MSRSSHRARRRCVTCSRFARRYKIVAQVPLNENIACVECSIIYDRDAHDTQKETHIESSAQQTFATCDGQWSLTKWAANDAQKTKTFANIRQWINIAWLIHSLNLNQTQLTHTHSRSTPITPGWFMVGQTMTRACHWRGICRYRQPHQQKEEATISAPSDPSKSRYLFTSAMSMYWAYVTNITCCIGRMIARGFYRLARIASHPVCSGRLFNAWPGGHTTHTNLMISPVRGARHMPDLEFCDSLDQSVSSRESSCRGVTCLTQRINYSLSWCLRQVIEPHQRAARKS